MMKNLNEELIELERELASRERKAAAQAKIEEETEFLRQESEARRLRQDEQRRLQKIREEQQVRKLAVYGTGAVGALTLITILIKAVL
jgi:hypothetical protein